MSTSGTAASPVASTSQVPLNANGTTVTRSNGHGHHNDSIRNDDDDDDDDDKRDDGSSKSQAEIEGEEEDLITTIESDLTLLIQIMSSSLHFLSNRSAHVQLSADIPLYNPTGAGQLMASKMLVDEASMAENIEELTDDLVGKVKDIEALMGKLPKEEDEELARSQIAELQQQFAGVNEDYRSAYAEAETLKVQLSALLTDLCNDYQSTREKLAKSVVSPSQ